MQLRVEVCDEVPNVTLDGKVQVRPVGVDADADNMTVPNSPLRPLR